MKKYRKLSGRFIFGIVAMSAVLMVTLSVVISMHYKADKENTCSELSLSYAKSLAQFIDGDKIEEYAETLQEDDYYYEIDSLIKKYAANSSITYYYVIVPYDDDFMYIWDSFEDGEDPLGYHEAYSIKGGEKALNEMYKDDPENMVFVFDSVEYGKMSSAYYPILDSSGEIAALAGVDLKIPDMESVILKFVLIIVLVVFITVLITAVFYYIFMKKWFVLPISELNKKVKEVVVHLESEDEFKVNVKTGDEIEELADSFTIMFSEVKNYISEISRITSEREKIEAELNVAANIQLSMLPNIFPKFSQRKDIDIFASMKPAKEVGGDFYDFYLVDDDHLCLTIADVSGKGVPAALFMVIAKTLLKDNMLMGKSPSKAFKDVNNMLIENNEEGLFVTACLAVLEISTGTLTFVNAGHNPSLIKTGENDFEYLKLKPGVVLACVPNMEFVERKVQISEGDVLFMYTDGITEAKNKAGELYGEDRLLQTINKADISKTENVLNTVKDNVEGFASDAPQFDDMTMIAVKYKGLPTEKQ